MNYQKIIFIVLIVFVACLEVGGDILFKKWSIDGRNGILVIGLLMYLLGAGIWAMSLRYEYLSKAIVAFVAINLIFDVLAGVLIFGDHLTIPQKAGIVLSLLAVIVTEM